MPGLCAAVPRRARACPNCGADERSGWNEDAARYDGLDLPEQAFEDESMPSGGKSQWPGQKGDVALLVDRRVGGDVAFAYLVLRERL